MDPERKAGALCCWLNNGLKKPSSSAFQMIKKRISVHTHASMIGFFNTINIIIILFYNSIFCDTQLAEFEIQSVGCVV